MSQFNGTQRRVERISQSVVEIRTSDTNRDFESIRSIFLQWLRDKAGRELPTAMICGETDSLDLLGAQRVETAAMNEPKLWAARQDFQDQTVPRRSWVTEAMLARANAWTLLVGFRLHCVTLGEPAPFSRSVPRFMREIARSHHVWLDGVETDLLAEPVETQEETDGLIRLLTDPQRKSPVVGISMDELQGNGRPLIQADKFANAVFGTAHVRLLTRQASFWLTDRLGKRLSVFNGAVRVWLPNLRPEQADPYDHPLWLAERIDEDGELATRLAITDRLLRASAGRRDADQAIPSFAEARRAVSTLSREMAADSGRSANDLVPLYEAEVLRLNEELKEAKADQATLLAIADEDLREATADRDELRAEIYALQARLVEMERAIRTREQKPGIDFPDNFEELEAWAKLYVSDNVELLSRALNAAKKSKFHNPPLAYQALLLLHETYVPMRRLGSQVMKERWENVLRQLGLECSPANSGARAGENANDYFVTHGGRRREIDMHLKGSNSRNPRYCFRVYFFWDDDNARVVVASLPGHLETRIS
jgi:hypothetical protein